MIQRKFEESVKNACKKTIHREVLENRINLINKHKTIEHFWFLTKDQLVARLIAW